MNQKRKNKLSKVAGGFDSTVTKKRVEVVQDKGSTLGLDLDISGNLNIFSVRG